jgi:hypothetical protein
MYLKYFIGKCGIFPISYVNIIVDCANLVEPYKNTAVTVHENLKTDTYHKVRSNTLSLLLVTFS